MILRLKTSWRAVFLGVILFSAMDPGLRAQETVPIGVADEDEDPPGDPEVEAGWVAFRDGRHAEAQTIWRRAAAAGKASAYAGLGKLYWWGSGVAEDAVEARRLYALGAEKKDPDSLMDLAEMLMLGEGGAKEFARSRKLLEEAVTVGGASQVSRAQRLIQTLKIHVEEENRLIDENEEAEKFKNDRRPGADDFRAGQSHRDAARYADAVEALKRAVAQGHPGAFGLLGDLYSSGDGVVKDQAEARRLYAHGAALGDVEAMLGLAWAWLDGRGGPQDKAQAKYWFQKVATNAAASRRQRELAGVELADLKGFAIPANALVVAAPKLLEKSTVAAASEPAVLPVTPAVVATAVVPPKPVATVVAAAAAVELAPPALKLSREGKPELPYPELKPQAPMALERAWRAKISAALSAGGSPSYARAIALQEYLAGLNASEVTAAVKNSAARTRIEEVALEDFFAVGIALPPAIRNTWDHVLAASTREQLNRFDEVRSQGNSALTQAGFPEGLGVANVDLERAQRALAANDHAGRLMSLREAAAKGSPEAMRLIAEMYRRGQGVPADPVLAVRWTYFAATKHHAPAMLQLAEDCEKGVAAGGPVQMRAWRNAVRELPPPIRAERRVSLTAEPYDFAAYLSTIWEVTFRFNNGKSVKTHFKFAPAGSGFTLTYDVLTTNPATTSVWLTQRQYSTYDARTYTVLNFNIMGRDFTGNLNGRYLEGRFDQGSWNASRRADLDYLGLGDEAKARQRPDDAIYYYSQAIDEKRNALNYQRRSGVYYDLLDYEPAIADLDEALRLEPANPISLINRALAHLGRENFSLAVADATTALGLPPGVLTDDMRNRLYRARAQAHIRLGADTEAQSDFDASRKINPKQPQTRDEIFLGIRLSNQVVNEAYEKLGENAQKLNEGLQKLNQDRPPSTPPAQSSEPEKKD